MDGAQVGVLEETNEVSLGGLLEGQHCRGLEAQVGLEVLSDLSHKALEWQLADEELSALLVTTDLTKSDGSRAVTVGLLDSSRSGSRLPGCLGGQLLTGSLSSSGLASGLLGTGHCCGALHDTSDEVAGPFIRKPRASCKRAIISSASFGAKTWRLPRPHNLT